MRRGRALPLRRPAAERAGRGEGALLGLGHAGGFLGLPVAGMNCSSGGGYLHPAPPCRFPHQVPLCFRTICGASKGRVGGGSTSRATEGLYGYKNRCLGCRGEGKLGVPDQGLKQYVTHPGLFLCGWEWGKEEQGRLPGGDGTGLTEAWCDPGGDSQGPGGRDSRSRSGRRPSRCTLWSEIKGLNLMQRRSTRNRAG